MEERKERAQRLLYSFSDKKVPLSVSKKLAIACCEEVIFALKTQVVSFDDDIFYWQDVIKEISKL
jgi:hypothetical protein